MSDCQLEICPYAQLHQGLHILHVEVVRVCSHVAGGSVGNPGALVRERVPDVDSFPWKRNRVSPWPAICKAILVTGLGGL
jgi:hypothetical protein